MKFLKIGLISGLLLIAMGSFSAQNLEPSQVQATELGYWNSEINLAKGGRMPVGRFLERTLEHVASKSDWHMVDDKLVAKKHIASGRSTIVVLVEVDCQARVIGGRAEVESH